MRTREQIKLETQRLKAEYGELFVSVTDILFRPDPIGINFEDNLDEYYPEARRPQSNKRYSGLAGKGPLFCVG